MILVSACLLGFPCKYSGKSNLNPRVIEKLAGQIYLPVCPEVLGGLPVPRLPGEISGGSAADVLAGRARVIDNQGGDCTEAFLLGAEKTLRIAKNAHTELAVLKKNSPSCGHGTVYDGHFCGRMIPGNGVTAELLQQHGITVMQEEEFIREGEAFRQPEKSEDTGGENH